MEKEFIRVRSVKDIAVSVILAAAGILLAAIPSSVPLNIIGYVLVFTGLFLFFAMKSSYRDKETGESYCKKERYFPQSMKESISKAFESPGDNEIDLPGEDKAIGLRVDFYYSKKTSEAYVRLYEYVPYQYVPASGYFRCHVKRIGKLIR